MFVTHNDIIIGWKSEDGKRPPFNNFSDYRIVNGEAFNVTARSSFFIDSVGRKHLVDLGGLQNLDCALNDDVEFDGQAWSVISDANVIAKIADAQVKLLNSNFTASLAVLTDPYPSVERESWRIQEAEARAYVIDDTVPIPFINALVAAESVSVENKVVSIIAKADAFKLIVATAVGNRQRLEDQVNAIASDGALTLQQKTDQINAITWGSL